MHGTVFTATFAVLIAAVSAHSQNPRVLLSAGVYEGVRDPTFGQDYFLGIPYAQPPIGPLRFQNPEPLNVSWNGIKTAKAYSASCVGYLVGAVRSSVVWATNHFESLGITSTFRAI